MIVPRGAAQVRRRMRHRGADAPRAGRPRSRGPRTCARSRRAPLRADPSGYWPTTRQPSPSRTETVPSSSTRPHGSSDDAGAAGAGCAACGRRRRASARARPGRSRRRRGRASARPRLGAAGSAGSPSSLGGLGLGDRARLGGGLRLGLRGAARPRRRGSAHRLGDSARGVGRRLVGRRRPRVCAGSPRPASGVRRPRRRRSPRTRPPSGIRRGRGDPRPASAAVGDLRRFGAASRSSVAASLSGASGASVSGVGVCCGSHGMHLIAAHAACGGVDGSQA